jgi:hypothetical protein
LCARIARICFKASRFNRIDAQFERLIALVQRAETKDC